MFDLATTYSKTKMQTVDPGINGPCLEYQYVLINMLLKPIPVEASAHAQW